MRLKTEIISYKFYYINLIYDMMLRVEKDFNSTSAIHVDPQVRGTKTDSAPEAWQQAKHIAARKDAAILPLGTVAAPA